MYILIKSAGSINKGISKVYSKVYFGKSNKAVFGGNMKHIFKEYHNLSKYGKYCTIF